MAGSFASQDDKKGSNYAPMFFSGALTTLTHPIQMSKVLIQVGYEPKPPVPFKNIFGKQMYKLPGFLTYTSTIYNVDGFFGLFRGVSPRIASCIISSSINNSIMNHLHSLDKKDETAVPKSESEIEFLKETCYQSISRVTSTIITYPLQVISIRMIVQFVGRETKYVGVIQSIRDIYHEEGILGLFSGLIPQILGDLLTLWMFRGLTYCVNRAVASEMGDFRDLKLYTQQASQIIVSSLTYPFVLVANLMSVSHCSLHGASALPQFDGWTQCWGTLRKHRLLWRGSSVFRRTSATNLLGPLTLRTS